DLLGAELRRPRGELLGGLPRPLLRALAVAVPAALVGREVQRRWLGGAGAGARPPALDLQDGVAHQLREPRPLDVVGAGLRDRVVQRAPVDAAHGHARPRDVARRRLRLLRGRVELPAGPVGGGPLRLRRAELEEVPGPGRAELLADEV